MPRARARDGKSVPGGPRAGDSANSTQSANSATDRARLGLLIAALVVAGVAVIAADFVFGAIFGNGESTTPTPAASASARSIGTASGLVLLLPR